MTTGKHSPILSNLSETLNMDFNNKITPETVNTETSEIQTTQSNTVPKWVQSKWTWAIFITLIILCIAIPQTINRRKKETSTTTIVITEKTLTTTEGIYILMNTTGITLPLITQIPNCTLKDCRTRIADYFSANRPFFPYQLAECKNCPALNYLGGTIGPSNQWKTMWLEYDFFIKNSIGQDCEKNPIKGNKLDCMVQCFIDTTCVAFSRQKMMGDQDEKGECWLKTNITVNQTPNDPDWHTIILNAKS